MARKEKLLILHLMMAGKYTAELLNTLKQHDAKATFFLIGANVKSFQI